MIGDDLPLRIYRSYISRLDAKEMITPTLCHSLVSTKNGIETNNVVFNSTVFITSSVNSYPWMMISLSVTEMPLIKD